MLEKRLAADDAFAEKGQSLISRIAGATSVSGWYIATEAWLDWLQPYALSLAPDSHSASRDAASVFNAASSIPDPVADLVV